VNILILSPSDIKGGAQEFALEIQARRYLSLFSEILEKSDRSKGHK
jgi:hypothetical protein